MQLLEQLVWGKALKKNKAKVTMTAKQWEKISNKFYKVLPPEQADKALSIIVDIANVR